MDYHTPLKTQTGASLVEICITIVIISMTTLIILSFTRSTSSMSRDARASDAAYLSAERKITELSKMSNPTSGNDNDILDNIELKRQWTVKDTFSIKRVIVTVTFSSLQGSNRSIILAGAVN
ncbi:MAG: hypothetical protein JW915_18765 [Chitinispirillaceae bacterium]|nr:hypothetical protein [Chitinispirillaceae bacterium]